MDLAFVVDLPVTLATDGDAATSRVQVAKTGTFKDPRYGKFSITSKDFSKWMENFNALSIDDGRLGLPVDVDHSPEKRGTTEAAGWITKLDTMGEDGKTPTPNELWGTVEWNTLGAELVKDRRYAYLSPSYQHQFRDEQGRQHGTALVGVALTNRPFLQMATVSLSSALSFAAEEDAVEPVGDSPAHMSDFKNIALSLGLAEDADEAAILSAIKEAGSATVDLDALATENGKVVLSADLVTQLTADATAGREAAKTLSTMRFESAWSTAVTEGRKLPAEREVFEKLYALDADSTIEAIEKSGVVLSTTPVGSGGAGGTQLTGTMQRDAEGQPVDPDRLALHERALVLAAERSIDYADAVTLAAEGV